MRTTSSTLIERVATSATLDALARSRSRAIARRIGSSRGWLARASRSSLCFRVATSGSALPVRADCCTAARIADSMSLTRFSSRERATERTSSSSWPRCSATSPSRASSSATLAVASCIASWAWRASSSASATRSALSCWRFTSSRSLLCTRWSARQASASARTETIVSSRTMGPLQRQSSGLRGDLAATGVETTTGGSAAGEESSFTVASIVCRRPPHRCRAAPRRPRRSRPVAPAPRCADGWRARAIRARSRRRRGASSRSTASELLKSHAWLRRRGEGGVDVAALLGRELRREAPVGGDGIDRGTGLDEALHQPVAAAVAAHDQDAAAVPVVRPQLLARAIRSRAAARRRPARRSPPPARPRRAGSRAVPGPGVAASSPAGQAAPAGRAAKKRATALLLTNTTRPRPPRPCHASATGWGSSGAAISISGTATASTPRAISFATQGSA